MKQLKLTEHDPTIFNINSKELYINLKPSDIPPKGHPDRKPFIDIEFTKCKDGLNINGEFLPPSLYYDLCFHKIELDEEGRGVGNPVLRDNGWIIHNDIWRASQQKVNYSLAGARQLGKSDTLVSLTMRDINVFGGTKSPREALVMFGASPDKDTFTKKAKTAIDNGEAFMQVPLLDNDWKKQEIRFGFKETDNKKHVYKENFVTFIDTMKQRLAASYNPDYKQVAQEFLERKQLEKKTDKLIKLMDSLDL
jgi:hypothetical protein